MSGVGSDVVLLWNEDHVEPRYGVVREVRDGWVRVEGCAPRVGDALSIIGSSSGADAEGSANQGGG